MPLYARFIVVTYEIEYRLFNVGNWKTQILHFLKDNPKMSDVKEIETNDHLTNGKYDDFFIIFAYM